MRTLHAMRGSGVFLYQPYFLLTKYLLHIVSTRHCFGECEDKGGRNTLPLVLYVILSFFFDVT
jgi:hypothetical protein